MKNSPEDFLKKKQKILEINKVVLNGIGASNIDRLLKLFEYISQNVIVNQAEKEHEVDPEKIVYNLLDD